MADPRPLDAVRLTLMQDVLPMGLALVERVRRGALLAWWRRSPHRRILFRICAPRENQELVSFVIDWIR